MTVLAHPDLRLVGEQRAGTPVLLPEGVRALHVEDPALLTVVADTAAGGSATEFRRSSIWSDSKHALPFGYLPGDPHRQVVEAGESPARCTWEECPACQASSWQGNSRYPGVDTWMNQVADSGTVLLSVGTSSNGFFTTVAALVAVEHDLGVLCRGLQIAQCSQGSARRRISLVQLVQDRVVAAGIALANSQHGEGGLPQVFMPMSIPASDEGRVAS